jgi:hypothetical protein
MPASDPRLIAALLTAKTALEGALLALTEPSPPADQPAETAAPSRAVVDCKHERREDQRSFGVTEAWRCLDCGYEYRR